VRAARVTVYLDQEISGNGQYNFGGARINFVLIELDVLGPKVFIADLGNTDQIAQAGWFALGSRSDYGTSVDHVFWTERKWINFQSFEWHPEPTVDVAAATDLAVWASDVRWALSPGTHGFMFVFGV
jgi:hypothetical protein